MWQYLLKKNWKGKETEKKEKEGGEGRRKDKRKEGNYKNSMKKAYYNTVS